MSHGKALEAFPTSFVSFFFFWHQQKSYRAMFPSSLQGVGFSLAPLSQAIPPDKIMSHRSVPNNWNLQCLELSKLISSLRLCRRFSDLQPKNSSDRPESKHNSHASEGERICIMFVNKPMSFFFVFVYFGATATEADCAVPQRALMTSRVFLRLLGLPLLAPIIAS